MSAVKVKMKPRQDDSGVVDLLNEFGAVLSSISPGGEGGGGNFYELADVAALTLAADKFVYFTDADSIALADLSSFARTILDDANAAATRTTLGATAVGDNIFTLTNPGAVTFLRMNADNTVTARSASDFRSDIGLPIGTSGATVPLLNAANTFGNSLTQTIHNTLAITNGTTTANTTIATPSGYSAGLRLNGNLTVGTNYLHTTFDSVLGRTFIERNAADGLYLREADTTSAVVAITLQRRSSTTANRNIGKIDHGWTTSTDASRAGWMKFHAGDAAGWKECIKIEASGTAAMIGFLGAAAVVRQTVSAAATDAATTQTLVNDIRTALINLGLAV